MRSVRSGATASTVREASARASRPGVSLAVQPPARGFATVVCKAIDSGHDGCAAECWERVPRTPSESMTRTGGPRGGIRSAGRASGRERSAPAARNRREAAWRRTICASRTRCSTGSTPWRSSPNGSPSSRWRPPSSLGTSRRTARGSRPGSRALPPPPCPAGWDPRRERGEVVAEPDRLVWAAGFEPATPGTQSPCSTRLSYAQTRAQHSAEGAPIGSSDPGRGRDASPTVDRCSIPRDSSYPEALYRSERCDPCPTASP